MTLEFLSGQFIAVFCREVGVSWSHFMVHALSQANTTRISLGQKLGRYLMGMDVLNLRWHVRTFPQRGNATSS